MTKTVKKGLVFVLVFCLIITSLVFDIIPVNLNSSNISYAADQIIPVVTVTASSSYSSETAPSETVDGIIQDQNNCWASKSDPTNSQWIEYDLGTSQDITNAVLYFRNLSGNAFCVPTSITFQVSNDNSNWTTAAIGKSTNVPTEDTNYSTWPSYTYNLNFSGRYLKLLFTDGSQNTQYGCIELTEIQIYGNDNIQAQDMIAYFANQKSNSIDFCVNVRAKQSLDDPSSIYYDGYLKSATVYYIVTSDPMEKTPNTSTPLNFDLAETDTTQLTNFRSYAITHAHSMRSVRTVTLNDSNDLVTIWQTGSFTLSDASSGLFMGKAQLKNLLEPYITYTVYTMMDETFYGYDTTPTTNVIGTQRYKLDSSFVGFPGNGNTFTLSGIVEPIISFDNEDSSDSVEDPLNNENSFDPNDPNWWSNTGGIKISSTKPVTVYSIAVDEKITVDNINSEFMIDPNNTIKSLIKNTDNDTYPTGGTLLYTNDIKEYNSNISSSNGNTIINYKDPMNSLNIGNTYTLYFVAVDSQGNCSNILKTTDVTITAGITGPTLSWLQINGNSNPNVTMQMKRAPFDSDPTKYSDVVNDYNIQMRTNLDATGYYVCLPKICSIYNNKYFNWFYNIASNPNSSTQVQDIGILGSNKTALTNPQKYQIFIQYAKFSGLYKKYKILQDYGKYINSENGYYYWKNNSLDSGVKTNIESGGSTDSYGINQGNDIYDNFTDSSTSGASAADSASTVANSFASAICAGVGVGTFLGQIATEYASSALTSGNIFSAILQGAGATAEAGCAMLTYYEKESESGFELAQQLKSNEDTKTNCFENQINNNNNLINDLSQIEFFSDSEVNICDTNINKLELFCLMSYAQTKGGQFETKAGNIGSLVLGRDLPLFKYEYLSVWGIDDFLDSSQTLGTTPQTDYLVTCNGSDSHYGHRADYSILPNKDDIYVSTINIPHYYVFAFLYPTNTQVSNINDPTDPTSLYYNLGNSFISTLHMSVKPKLETVALNDESSKQYSSSFVLSNYSSITLVKGYKYVLFLNDNPILDPNSGLLLEYRIYRDGFIYTNDSGTNFRPLNSIDADAFARFFCMASFLNCTSDLLFPDIRQYYNNYWIGKWDYADPIKITSSTFTTSDINGLSYTLPSGCN